MYSKIRAGVLCLLMCGALLANPADGNLLKNASLLQATNPNFPDFWLGASGWRPEAHRLSDEAFIRGTRSMMLTNSSGRETTFASSNFGWSPGSEGTVYTFSVYLKASPPGLSALIGGSKLIGVSRLEQREVKVGADWQRYTVTAPLKAAGGWAGRFLEVGVTLPGKAPGSLYANAPVLVRGTEAPEFSAQPAGAAPKPEEAAKRELIGEWILEEGAAKSTDGAIVIADGSGRNNPGRVVGGASWVKTEAGGALSFDGSTYIEVPYSSTLRGDPESVSIEILLKPDSGQPMPVLIRGMHFGGYALRTESGRYRSIVGGWGGTLNGGNVIPRATHLVITYKKPESRIYLDGELAGKRELTLSMSPEAEKRPLFIGAFDVWSKEKGYHPEPGFKGWIRLVRIYKNALSEEDVKDLYAKALPGR